MGVKRIFLTLALAFTVAACNGGDFGLGDSTGGGSSKPTELGSIALTPDASWHDTYQVGSHKNFACDTCHVAGRANEEICAGCHINKFNATSNPSHAQYKIGTRCNACHFSDSFTSHSRVSHSAFHMVIETNCESCHKGRQPGSHNSDGRTVNCASCHQYNNGAWGVSGGAHNHTSGCVNCHSNKKPASHNGNRDSSCESCHSYPTWSGASFSHSGVSSGCNQCHSRHYDGNDCSYCHTKGISWSWSHSRVSSSGCPICHDGGDDDDDFDDDDD
jgi:hypothetical protein